MNHLASSIKTFGKLLIKRVLSSNQKSEDILQLRSGMQKLALDKYSLKPRVSQENDGSVTLSLEQLGLHVTGPTIETAMDTLHNTLKEYAQEYDSRLNSLNEQDDSGQYPYVLRILLCDSDDEIRSLLLK